MNEYKHKKQMTKLHQIQKMSRQFQIGHSVCLFGGDVVKLMCFQSANTKVNDKNPNLY